MRVRRALRGLPLPACGERAGVSGSRKGKALREGLGRSAADFGKADASFAWAVERLAPLAAPHPDPLPVALGTIVERSSSLIARGRRGEGDRAGRGGPPAC